MQNKMAPRNVMPSMFFVCTSEEWGVSTVSTVYSPFSALQPCSPASLPEQGRTAHTLYIMLEASAWISLKRAWILSTAKRLYTNSQRQRTQNHEEDILQTSNLCAWNCIVQYNCQLHHSWCLQQHNARYQQFPLPAMAAHTTAFGTLTGRKGMLSPWYEAWLAWGCNWDG